MQDGGLDTVEANLHLGFGADQRDYSAAIAILEDLGRHRGPTAHQQPGKIAALERSSIRLVGRVPLVVPPTDHNRGYLDGQAAAYGAPPRGRRAVRMTRKGPPTPRGGRLLARL